ncbi:MAG: acyl carrier protein [Gloeocapsa sp. DLM2.Bin57]|nr:MAG: acyl carrier protein [Gloeocapsa sp. DLM2.Bin57]
MNEEIFARVKKVVVEKLEVEEEQVKLEADFANDLGADSLDLVELIMALEEEFNIEVSDEVAEQLDTVAKVVEHISKEKEPVS